MRPNSSRRTESGPCRAPTSIIPTISSTTACIIGVKYEPAESDSGLFGGNSNWRGPIWMPVNYLLIENLRRFHLYYGDGLKIECPTGSGVMLTLNEIADELCRRVLKLFLRGRRRQASGFRGL